MDLAGVLHLLWLGRHLGEHTVEVCWVLVSPFLEVSLGAHVFIDLGELAVERVLLLEVSDKL